MRRASIDLRWLLICVSLFGITLDSVYFDVGIRLRVEYVTILFSIPLFFTDVIKKLRFDSKSSEIIKIWIPLLTAMTISTILAEDIYLSLKGAIGYILYLMLIIYLVKHLNSRERLLKFTSLWVRIGECMAILAIIQTIMYVVTGSDFTLDIVKGYVNPSTELEMDLTYRARPFFGDPNTFGAFLLCSFPFLLSRMVADLLAKRSYTLDFLWILVYASAILLTASKSTILGAFSQFIVIIFSQCWRGNSSNIRLFAFTSLIILVIFALFQIEFIDVAISNRLDSIGEFDNSTESRFYLATVAVKIWLDNIFFGVGLNNFQIFYTKFFGGGLGWGVHIYLLQILADMGLFGVFAIIYIQSQIYRRCLFGSKTESFKSDWHSIAGAAGIIGLFVSNIGYATIPFGYYHIMAAMVFSNYFVKRCKMSA